MIGHNVIRSISILCWNLYYIKITGDISRRKINDDNVAGCSLQAHSHLKCMIRKSYLAKINIEEPYHLRIGKVKLWKYCINIGFLLIDILSEISINFIYLFLVLNSKKDFLPLSILFELKCLSIRPDSSTCTLK